MKIGGVDSSVHTYVPKKSEPEPEVNMRVEENTRPSFTPRENTGEYREEGHSVSEKAIIEAIERANKAIEGTHTEARFTIHEATHEICVKIIDKEKNEVIREIPPEKILDLVARMWELAGIFVDEKR